MGRHEKTNILIRTAYEVLKDEYPMTLRQVFYQLVSRQVLENTQSAYKQLSSILVTARREGDIPWDWIEDRSREPRTVSMWDDLKDFINTVKKSYRRDVWESQAEYLEVWLEKDALSGIFESELRDYGVTLNVGRGYDGWSSIYSAADRIKNKSNVTILYFGDFDPSGEDMVRSLETRLEFFECYPIITKCALTYADIVKYQLPPAAAKKTDTRAAGFIAKHGEVSCVELDALPVGVLRERIRAEVENRIDLEALEKIRQKEKTERAKLEELLVC